MTFISVLIPTRGRYDACLRAVASLLGKAAVPRRVEILLRADTDDPTDYEHLRAYAMTVLPICAGITVVRGPRHGYGGMPHYLAELARAANGKWLLIWNDDALMQTRNWDAVPTPEQRQGLRLLCCRTQEERDRPMTEPYGSQFMFVPAVWYWLLGHLGQHQHADTWLWIIARRLGFQENVAIDVLHDRADLTGGNHDQTYQERVYVGLDNDDPRLEADVEKFRWYQVGMQGWQSPCVDQLPPPRRSTQKCGVVIGVPVRHDFNDDSIYAARKYSRADTEVVVLFKGIAPWSVPDGVRVYHWQERSGQNALYQWAYELALAEGWDWCAILHDDFILCEAGWEAELEAIPADLRIGVAGWQSGDWVGPRGETEQHGPEANRLRLDADGCAIIYNMQAFAPRGCFSDFVPDCSYLDHESAFWALSHGWATWKIHLQNLHAMPWRKNTRQMLPYPAAGREEMVERYRAQGILPAHVVDEHTLNLAGRLVNVRDEGR